MASTSAPGVTPALLNKLKAHAAPKPAQGVAPRVERHIVPTTSTSNSTTSTPSTSAAPPLPLLGGETNTTTTTATTATTASTTALTSTPHVDSDSYRGRAKAWKDEHRARVANDTVVERLPSDIGNTMSGDRWRARVGLTEGTRVCVVSQAYPDFRDALLERGWKQNPDFTSPHFDLKYVLKAKDANHRELLPHQAVNHFEKSNAICTKAGLLRCLRNTHWFAPVESHAIYPRAYDLADPTDYSDFVDDFRCVAAESLLRTAVVSLLLAAIKANAVTANQLVPPDQRNGGGSSSSSSTTTSSINRSGAVAGAALGGSEVPFDRALYLPTEAMSALLCQKEVLSFLHKQDAPSFNLGALKAALHVTKKRNRKWDDADLDDPEAGNEHVITNKEWEIIRYCDIFTAGGPLEQAPKVIATEKAQRKKETEDNIKKDRAVKRAMKRSGRAAAKAALLGNSSGGLKTATATAAVAVASSAASTAAKKPAENNNNDEDNSNDDDDEEDDSHDDEDDSNDDDGNDGSSNDDDDDDDSDDDASDASDDSNSPRLRDKALNNTATAALNNKSSSTFAATLKKALANNNIKPPFGGGKAASANNAGGAGGGGGGGGGSTGSEFKVAGAASGMQLRAWRERLEKEGVLDTGAYSERVGEPEPTFSSKLDPALATLARIDSSLWKQVIAAIGSINDSSRCQSSLNGCPPKNVWIVKPAGKSRGRGIECESSLSHILTQRGGNAHKETHWIVQKYIERPLLIKGKKWDIRQWVLVTSWNPLTIWFYKRCYLRFCSYPYELGNLSNRYIHLSNNSIQKHSAAFDASDIEGNMWHMADFSKWLQERDAEGAWDGLLYTPAYENDGSNLVKPSAASKKGAKASASSISGNNGSSSSGSSSNSSYTTAAAASSSSSSTSSSTSPPPPPPPPLVQDAATLLNSMPKGSWEQAYPNPVPISGCKDIWGTVLQPQIRRIVSWSLQAAQDAIDGRPNSFEIYGFDFMIDADLHPWLIEINSSPDFSYSTAVTEELVQAASEGIAQVVVDHRDWEKENAAAKAAAKAAAVAATTTTAGGGGSGSSSSSKKGSGGGGGGGTFVKTPAPDTGEWECLFKSNLSLGSVLTCTASGMGCVGSQIKIPGAKRRAAAAAAALAGNNGTGAPAIGSAAKALAALMAQVKNRSEKEAAAAVAAGSSSTSAIIDPSSSLDNSTASIESTTDEQQLLDASGSNSGTLLNTSVSSSSSSSRTKARLAAAAALDAELRLQSSANGSALAPVPTASASSSSSSSRASTLPARNTAIPTGKVGLKLGTAVVDFDPFAGFGVVGSTTANRPASTGSGGSNSIKENKLGLLGHELGVGGGLSLGSTTNNYSYNHNNNSSARRASPSASSSSSSAAASFSRAHALTSNDNETDSSAWAPTLQSSRSALSGNGTGGRPPLAASSATLFGTSSTNVLLGNGGVASFGKK